MKKQKPCNQFFVKDKYRDMSHMATVRCAICNEESHIEGPTILLSEFTKLLLTFSHLHDVKGCNEEQVKGPIEWAG